MVLYGALTLTALGILVVLQLCPSTESRSIAHALLSDGPTRPQMAPSPTLPLRVTVSPSRRWQVCLLGGLLFCVLRIVLCGFTVSAAVISFGIGVLAGELLVRRISDSRRKRTLRRMEWYLPSVMERVVMAVGAGMDVIPALQEAARKGNDPVSELFHQVVRLSECGAPVDSAFEQVARQVPSMSVKHAFVHLALAYRQGGEIVRPLKELSDATQLAYQESVEEVIAKLPVKAVLPLVVTFAGLIVCFLTVPLLHVGSIASRVAHATR